MVSLWLLVTKTIANLGFSFIDFILKIIFAKRLLVRSSNFTSLRLVSMVSQAELNWLT
jgi:hypothetical protein